MERDTSGFPLGWSEEKSLLLGWYLEWNWYFLMIGGSILSVVCAVWIARSRRWRAFYFFLAAILAAKTAFNFVWSRFLVNSSSQFEYVWVEWLETFLYFIPLTLIAGVLACVVIRDWHDNLSHHWSHWCGVTGLLVKAAFSIVLYFWHRLNLPDGRFSFPLLGG